MATGQNAFSATLYGEVSTYDALNGGYQIIGNGYNGPQYQSLPVAGTRVIGLSPGMTFTSKGGATVTANSIIEVIPPALQPIGFSKKYLCDSTESQLNALRT